MRKKKDNLTRKYFERIQRYNEKYKPKVRKAKLKGFKKHKTYLMKGGFEYMDIIRQIELGHQNRREKGTENLKISVITIKAETVPYFAVLDRKKKEEQRNQYDMKSNQSTSLSVSANVDLNTKFAKLNLKDCKKNKHDSNRVIKFDM